MTWDIDERVRAFRDEIKLKASPEEFYEKFEEALLLGYIAGDIKFTKMGECEFIIRVPHKYTEHCSLLRHAIGMPVEIFIKKWDPDRGSNGGV